MNSLPYDDEHIHAAQEIELCEDECGSVPPGECLGTCTKMKDHHSEIHAHAEPVAERGQHKWIRQGASVEKVEEPEPEPSCGEPCDIPDEPHCFEPCVRQGLHKLHNHPVGDGTRLHSWFAEAQPYAPSEAEPLQTAAMSPKVKVWNIVLAGFTYGSLTADDFAQIREALESVFDVHGSGVAPGGLILQSMFKNTAYPDTQDGSLLEIETDRLRHEYPLLPNGMEIKAEKAAREHDVVEAAREYVAAKDAWNDSSRPSAEIMKRRMKAMHALRNSLIRADRE